MSVRTCRLSTFDNHFDPLNQFKDWMFEDNRLGHGAMSRLARVSKVSDDEFTDEENEIENERAIDQIIAYDPLNIFRKLVYIDGKLQGTL